MGRIKPAVLKYLEIYNLWNRTAHIVTCHLLHTSISTVEHIQIVYHPAGRVHEFWRSTSSVHYICL